MAIISTDATTAIITEEEVKVEEVKQEQTEQEEEDEEEEDDEEETALPHEDGKLVSQYEPYCYCSFVLAYSALILNA